MQLSNSDYMFAASQLSSIASSSAQSSSTLNSIRSQLSSAIDEMEDNTIALGHIERLLDGVLDEIKSMHFTIYTQNNITNNLLQSIDETLKTPSQTAAREQFFLATGLMENHSYERAKAYLEKAIELDPLVYAYYTNLSTCNYKIGSYRDAAICAKESLLYTDSSAELEAYSRYLLALSLYELGQVEHAVSELDKAAQISKKPGPYFYYAAIFYTKHKDYIVQKFNYYLFTSFMQDTSFIYFSMYEKALKSMKYEVNDMINEFKLMVIEELEKTASSIKSTPLPTYNFEIPNNCITRPDRFYWHAYRESLNIKDDWEWNKYRYNGNSPMMLVNNVHLTYENFIAEIRNAATYEYKEWEIFIKNIHKTIKSQDLSNIIKMDEEVIRFKTNHKEYCETLRTYTDRFVEKAKQYLDLVDREHQFYESELRNAHSDIKWFKEHQSKPSLFSKKDYKDKYQSELKKLEAMVVKPQEFMSALQEEYTAAENQLAAAIKFQKSFNSQPYPVIV